MGETIPESRRWAERAPEREAERAKLERRAFPDMKGFSPGNLRYMRAFAASYPDADFSQQVAAKLPWGRLMRLLDTVPDPTERDWYARGAACPRWKIWKRNCAQQAAEAVRCSHDQLTPRRAGRIRWQLSSLILKWPHPLP